MQTTLHAQFKSWLKAGGFYVLLAIILTASLFHSSYAQQSCKEKIESSKRVFDADLYRQLIDLLIECRYSGDLEDSLRSQVYEYLAISYLHLSISDSAEIMVLDLVKNFTNYQPDGTEPDPYIRLVTESQNLLSSWDSISRSPQGCDTLYQSALNYYRTIKYHYVTKALEFCLLSPKFSKVKKDKKISVFELAGNSYLALGDTVNADKMIGNIFKIKRGYNPEENMENLPEYIERVMNFNKESKLKYYWRKKEIRYSAIGVGVVAGVIVYCLLTKDGGEPLPGPPDYPTMR